MQFYAIMFAHWVGDFVLQTEWMATNKSKSWTALSAHVAMYTLVLGVCALTLTGWQTALSFTLFNAGLHFATDTVTSRITSYFWDKGNMRYFFVVIGLDQFLHFLALYATWQHFMLAS